MKRFAFTGKSVLFLAGLFLIMLGLSGQAMAAASESEPPLPASSSDTPAQTATPSSQAAPADMSQWEPQLTKIRKQFEVLQLLTTITAVTGLEVGIPKEIQHIPLSMIGEGEGQEKMKKLEKMGLDIYLKKVEFKKTAFSYNEKAKMVGDRPAIPSLLDFDKIGLEVDVKLGAARFPVGCAFRSGKLPLDFAVADNGYNINVLPTDRNSEAVLDNVEIDLGGPVSRKALSGIFGKDLAKLVLQFAANQTLKMDRSSLMGNSAGGVALPGVSSILGDILNK